MSNYFNQILFRIQDYYAGQLTVRSTLIQLLVIAGAFWLARKVTRVLKEWCNNLTQQCTLDSTTCDDLAEVIKFLRIITPFLAYLIIWIAFRVAQHFHWPQELLYISGILCIALTLVRLFTGQMKNRFWAGILPGCYLVMELAVYFTPHPALVCYFGSY